MCCISLCCAKMKCFSSFSAKTKLRSCTCFTNTTILRNEALFEKIGPIRVHTSYNTLPKCLENNE